MGSQERATFRKASCLRKPRPTGNNYPRKLLAKRTDRVIRRVIQISSETGLDMRIALHTPMAATRKEPLVEMTGRVRQAFLDAGLGEPAIRFTMVDTSGAKSVS